MVHSGVSKSEISWSASCLQKCFWAKFVSVFLASISSFSSRISCDVLTFTSLLAGWMKSRTNAAASFHYSAVSSKTHSLLSHTPVTHTHTQRPWPSPLVWSPAPLRRSLGLIVCSFFLRRCFWLAARPDIQQRPREDKRAALECRRFIYTSRLHFQRRQRQRRRVGVNLQ